MITLNSEMLILCSCTFLLISYNDALDALCDLTGENASENVINEVFERFCVGK